MSWYISCLSDDETSLRNCNSFLKEGEKSTELQKRDTEFRTGWRESLTDLKVLEIEQYFELATGGS